MCKQFFFRLLSRIKGDTNIIMTSMVNVCVSMFLEKRETILSDFSKEFSQLTAPDEKVDLVESFLAKLHAEVERDPMWISKFIIFAYFNLLTFIFNETLLTTSLWLLFHLGSTTEQLNLAQQSLERSVMSHVYIHALYPNGDGDVSRDQ